MLSCQCGCHRVPGQRLSQRHWLVQRDQAGLVGQEPAHGDVRLAVRGELRPVFGHRSVQVQLTTLNQQMRCARGRPLRRRVDQLQRVALPRTIDIGVGECPIGPPPVGRPGTRTPPRRCPRAARSSPRTPRVQPRIRPRPIRRSSSCRHRGTWVAQSEKRARSRCIRRSWSGGVGQCVQALAELAGGWY